MNPYKGVDNLLEIAKKCPEIQFDVVGRVDPQVQELVDELKKLPNVMMNNGYVTDKEMPIRISIGLYFRIILQRNLVWS